jgi:hypothetical protein
MIMGAEIGMLIVETIAKIRRAFLYRASRSRRSRLRKLTSIIVGGVRRALPSATNQGIQAAAVRIASLRRDGAPALAVDFFDAASAKVWG